MSFIIKDPAIYFVRTLLLRPARETEYRLEPLYKVFEGWRSLTGLSGYRPAADARGLLDGAGGWTLWSESGALQGTPGRDSWRWRVRVDTLGDDVSIICGIETENRLPAQTEDQIKARPSPLDAEQDRLRDQWLSRTKLFTDASAKLVAGFAEKAPQASQLRSTGDSWLYLFEWTDAPNWAEFGQARFGHGSYLIFDWGLFGLKAASGIDSSPVFEVHARSTTENMRLAEQFIFTDLPEFLIFYLKVTQFLANRHHRSLVPRVRALDKQLSQLSREVNRIQGRVNLRQAEQSLERIAAALGDFRSALAEMAIDRHTAQIDYENAESLLRKNRPQNGGEPIPFLRPLKNYLDQTGKDLEYYNLTIDLVMQTMELLKLKTEILRVRFSNILAAIGAGFGIFLGLGQLIDSNYLKDFMQRRWPGFPLSQYGNTSRAILCSVLAVSASLIVYGLLNRFLTAKSKG